MAKGFRWRETKRLLSVIPVLIVGGFFAGVVAAIVRVVLAGDLAYNLWHTALDTTNVTINHTVYGALSLAVFVMVLAWLQVMAGRKAAGALRAAVGFNLFFPLFLLVIWVATERAVTGFALATHKLPELVRQNDNLGRFLLENYLAGLNVATMPAKLLTKAGWLWPSFLLAGLFGVWFDRGLGWALRRRKRRAEPADPTRQRRLTRLTVSLVTVGAALIIINMAALTARLTNRELRPNVILISVDTLRADALGCYGNPRANTVALDRLAHNGVLFEDCISNSSWTLPGHGAMLTGVQPTALGLSKVTDRLSDNALTMAEVLRENGFATGAVTSYILLDRVYGFDQGFEYFDYVDNQPAGDIVDKAIAFVSRHERRKFFLFLHLYDPHWPYEPSEATAARLWPHGPTPEIRKLIDIGDYARFAIEVIRGPRVLNDFCRAMYDGEVDDVDTQLGRLLGHLVRRGLENRTVIVVTSDHGEEFLEHGLFGHGLTLYDESLRVPLIMRFPHLLPSGVRVKGQVQTLDIFPTVLGLVGLDAARYNLGGRDLLFSAAAGDVEPVPILAETSMSGDHRFAVRTGDHKLLTPVHLDFGKDLLVERGEEIYDLTVDPGETTNLAADQPETADALKALMARQLQTIRERWGLGKDLSHSRTLSPEETERLRSLGYIQ